jgi:hypothetical protein
LQICENKHQYVTKSFWDRKVPGQYRGGKLGVKSSGPSVLFSVYRPGSARNSSSSSSGGTRRSSRSSRGVKHVAVFNQSTDVRYPTKDELKIAHQNGTVPCTCMCRMTKADNVRLSSAVKAVRPLSTLDTHTDYVQRAYYSSGGLIGHRIVPRRKCKYQ